VGADADRESETAEDDRADVEDDGADVDDEESGGEEELEEDMAVKQKKKRQNHRSRAEAT
jgi:hypothetical protein